MKYPLLFLSFAWISLFISCDKDSTDTLNSSITGEWELVKAVEKQHLISFDYPDKLEKIIITFDDQENVTFSSYCNMGSAKYKIEDNKLQIYQLRLTEKACINVDDISWEDVAVNALLNPLAYQVQGQNLILQSEIYQLVFIKK